MKTALTFISFILFGGCEFYDYFEIESSNCIHQIETSDKKVLSLKNHACAVKLKIETVNSYIVGRDDFITQFALVGSPKIDFKKTEGSGIYHISDWVKNWDEVLKAKKHKSSSLSNIAEKLYTNEHVTYIKSDG